MVMNLILLLVSLLIYAGYGIHGLLYLVGAVILSWGAGILTKRWSWAAWVSVALNGLSLLMLKLQPLTGISWLSVMGISYFTLQIISYQIDVFRGKYPPERNFFKYALYVTWIPHLFMGPIERYDSMEPQLSAHRKLTWEDISCGGMRILVGAMKKMVIASRLAVVTGAISADPEKYHGAFAVLAVLMYSVQLYCDFSGGIDMILGVTRMCGIHMHENFRTPYFSESVREFWQRWHITLGAWLRDYIYIPLGGNRKGKLRKLLNTLITFLVSGLWHGAEYLLWGLLNGLFVWAGDRLKTRCKMLNRVGTFLVITLLWTFFVWPETATALKMLLSMVTTWNYGALFAQIGKLGLVLSDWFVLVAALLLLWLYDLRQTRLRSWFVRRSPAARLAVIGGIGLLVLVFGMYGIGFDADSFIYGGF